jgi:hypothetical protein
MSENVHTNKVPAVIKGNANQQQKAEHHEDMPEPEAGNLHLTDQQILQKAADNSASVKQLKTYQQMGDAYAIKHKPVMPPHANRISKTAPVQRMGIDNSKGVMQRVWDERQRNVWYDDTLGLIYDVDFDFFIDQKSMHGEMWDGGFETLHPGFSKLREGYVRQIEAAMAAKSKARSSYGGGTGATAAVAASSGSAKNKESKESASGSTPVYGKGGGSSSGGAYASSGKTKAAASAAAEYDDEADMGGDVEFDGYVTSIPDNPTIAGVVMAFQETATGYVLKPAKGDYPHVTFMGKKNLDKLHFSSARYDATTGKVNVIRKGYRWNGMHSILIDDPDFRETAQTLDATTTATHATFTLSGGREGQQVELTAAHVASPSAGALGASLKITK